MHYDAIVIGSGQGGNPLIYSLAEKGWKVALIEKEHLGGTCINTGCTPTKTMVASAQVAHYARNAARWGVRTAEVSVDLEAVVARKQAVVERFRGGHERKVRNPNITLYREKGRFLDARRVAVGEEVVESERIFINVGARPDVPPIPGIDSVEHLDNASIMELRRLPEHLLVLGGGYVGLEFGQMFRRFGSRVTVVHRGDVLLSREDPDVVEELRKALEAEGIRLLLSATTTRVEKTADGGIALAVEAGGETETLTGSHLLVATGRKPNTEDLGLERAGVATDARGFIQVNDRLETSVPGIWALGDVKGGPAFTHISWNDYQVIYGNLIEGKSLSIRDRIVPYAVFTDPPLGRVGMTETEARESGRKLKIGKIPAAWVARAIERDETAGMMKIVVEAETDRILGAAILSAEGGELVQILHATMLAGAPYTMLKGAIYIHPTMAEGFYALLDSVQ